MKRLLPLAFASIATTVSAPLFAADTITEALEASTPVLDLRLRYESHDADDAADADKAEAITLRTLVGIKTGEVNGFSGTIEMVDVSAQDVEDYDASTDGVADPEGNELNQAYLQYSKSDTVVRYGRQRIIYDGARFVGNVGWRQDEQTFDALSIQNKSIEGITFNAAYLTSINGIKFSKADAKSTLANVAFDNIGPGKLVTYFYGLDDGNDRTDDTFGLSYSGKVAMDSISLLYALEFASQDVEDATGAEAEADYSLIEVGAAVSGVTVKAGLETLGSDDGAYGFQTPLATKHKFNGWADKFLATPATGLEDMYISVGGKVAGTKLLAVFHDFTSAEDDIDYGSEVDLLAVKGFGKHYSIGAKYASYSADDFSVDADKFWFWGQAKF